MTSKEDNIVVMIIIMTGHPNLIKNTTEQLQDIIIKIMAIFQSQKIKNRPFRMDNGNSRAEKYILALFSGILNSTNNTVVTIENNDRIAADKGQL
jgi:hypothetical protein